MSSISGTAGAVYHPCYYINTSTGKMTFGKYNYTEMMEKMRSVPSKEGITYWEPDEYGRVYIDPEHPWQATLESEDGTNISLPDPGSAGLPSDGKEEERQKAEKKEERKAREEQLWMFREERERMARQEALLHRLTRTVLLLERS